VQSRDPRTPATGPGEHLGRLVAPRARQHGQKPFVTFSDAASGERTELGWATFENWTAKAANLLVEELELEPGDVLATDLGTHWTALVLQVAAWRAGVTVALPGAAGRADAVAFREDAGGALRDSAAPALVVGTGMAARMVGDPGSALPFAEEVLAFPDDFPDHAGGPDEPVLLTPGGARSSEDLTWQARALAGRAGLADAGRYLSAVPTDSEVGVVAAAVLALTTGSGVVLVARARGEGLAALARSERATALLLPSDLLGEVEAALSEDPEDDRPAVLDLGPAGGAAQ
jgi:uncharacterized protein (TIGR03089 family)